MTALAVDLHQPTEESLLDAATRLAGAERWGNLDTLEDLIAPDYQGFDVAGRPMNRVSVVSSYSGGKVRITGLRLSDLRARVVGRVGLVAGVVALCGRREDREFDLRLRFLDVYTWKDSGWQLLASQDARLP
jgi:Domain of unknown function (DUF4440)